MKYLIMLLLLTTPIKTGFAVKTNKSDYYTIQARITYYHPHQDKWGSRVADPKTRRAKHGITVAAHPDFKFGQKIEIPHLSDHFGDPVFIVQDRGGAVTSKKAAKGKGYVFDVFCKDVKTYRRMIKNKEWMKVKVFRK